MVGSRQKGDRVVGWEGVQSGNALGRARREERKQGTSVTRVGQSPISCDEESKPILTQASISKVVGGAARS